MPTLKKRITVNISKGTRARLAKLAKAQRRTVSNFVEVEIERRLEQLEAATEART